MTEAFLVQDRFLQRSVGIIRPDFSSAIVTPEAALATLTRFLGESQFVERDDLRAATLDILQPLDRTGARLPMLVKKINPHTDKYLDPRLLAYTSGHPEILQEIFEDKTFIQLPDSLRAYRIEDLSESLQMFVHLAWEQRMHFQLYYPFVPPALFTGFESKYHIHNTKGEKTFPAYYTILGVVEEYLELGPSVMSMHPSELTRAQKDQLLQFADLAERVFWETGFFADEAMQYPESGNLRFTKEAD